MYFTRRVASGGGGQLDELITDSVHWDGRHANMRLKIRNNSWHLASIFR